MALSLTLFCTFAVFSVIINGTRTKQEVLQEWQGKTSEQLEMQELLSR